MTKNLLVALAASVIATAVPTAVPAQAQVPEQTQQRIVYARSTGTTDQPELNEIFIMEADGTGVVQLTDNGIEDAYPALSPDGTRIVFSRTVRGQADLFLMNSDGTGRRRLTNTANADEVLATWSPDGKRIAFTAHTSTPEGWQSDIYRMRVSDSRFRRLTYTPRVKEFAPEWSPDGTRIAFSKHNQNQHKYGIATVRPNAEGLRWVAINPNSGAGFADMNPTWSPDSQWIAFSREHGADAYVDIYKVKRSGEGVMPVTELSELAETPSWGADGRILFMHNEGIAVVSAGGGDIEHITETRTGLPYWWPDW